jgi:cyclic pyranopterin phosphate synthase
MPTKKIDTPAKKHRPTAPPLSHVRPGGSARMVDVGSKPVTRRRAVAEARVRISRELARRVRTNSLDKGDLLQVARLAGIHAAKRTSDLIPLCHPLPIDAVDVRVELARDAVRIVAEVRAAARTGVEMEALTAAAVAALTIIDMGKSVDREVVIEEIRLLEKHGGRSGSFVARGKGTAP